MNRLESLNYQQIDNSLEEYKVKNKTVLITGGNGGLGKNLCLSYAKYGAKIINLSRNNDKMKELADSDNVAERLSESQTMGPAFDEMIGEAATGDKVDSFLELAKTG